MKNIALNLAVSSLMLNLKGQEQIIQGLYTESKILWESLIDSKTKTHLIGSVTVSKTKSDSVNHYIASLSKWVLNSNGAYMRGFSTEMLLRKHDEFMSIKGLIASTPALTNEKLFTEVLVHFFGYDEQLVRNAITVPSDKLEEMNRMVSYAVERFGLAEGVICEEKSGLTQVETYMFGELNKASAEFLSENLEDLCLRMVNECENSDPVQWLILQLPA